MEPSTTKLQKLNLNPFLNDSPTNNPRTGREHLTNPETIAPISIANVLFLEEERLNTSDTGRKYRRAANNNSANAANIFSTSAGK